MTRRKAARTAKLRVILGATEDDIDAITSLLQADFPSQGGSLTGEFPREKVVQMAEGGALIIVARRVADGPGVGVLFSAAKDTAQAPAVLAMLEVYAGGPGAYVYGPVCIADTERGQGLLALLYEAMRARNPGGEAVLFIRRDNIGSLRAHQRLGMAEVASYVLDGAQYAVYSDAATS